MPTASEHRGSEGGVAGGHAASSVFQGKACNQSGGGGGPAARRGGATLLPALLPVFTPLQGQGISHQTRVTLKRSVLEMGQGRALPDF